MIKKNSLNFLPESSPTSLPQPKSCSTLRAPFWSSCSSSHSLLRTLPSLILSADSRAYSGTPRLKKKTQKIKRLEIYVTKLPLSQSLLIVIYSLLDRHAFWAFDELPQSFFTFKPCHLHKELINDHAHKCGLSVLWFPLLNALQFLATPVTHSRSWTLPLPLASREKKKKGKKKQISILCPSSWSRPWSLRLDFICHHLLSDPHFGPLCQHLQILCFKSLSLYKSTKTPTNWVLCNVSLLTPPSQHFLHSTLYSISVPQHGMPSLSPSLWNTSTQNSPCFIHPHGWTQAHICTHRYTLFPSSPFFISWLEEVILGTFLVVWWLRICLPVQGVQFDPWFGK